MISRASWILVLLFLFSNPLHAGDCDTTFSSLADTQRAVQANKIRMRGMSDYDMKMFLTAPPEFERTMERLLGKRADLYGLIRAFRDGKIGNPKGASPVHWVDVGGGVGKAMREVASSKKFKKRDLKMTLVDLVDWVGHPDERLQRYFDDRVNISRALLAPANSPELRIADAKFVRFEQKDRPQLITSIESIQYWPDKLGGIVNLYNQLADHGILFLNASLGWKADIRTAGIDWGRRRADLKVDFIYRQFIRNLKKAGIEVFDDEENESLILIKKPGTELRLRAPFESGSAEYHGLSLYKKSREVVRIESP